MVKKNILYFTGITVFIFLSIIIGLYYCKIAFWLFPNNLDRNGEFVKLILSILGGIGILYGLFISYRRTLITERSVKMQGEAIQKQSEQLELSRKSQIDERFKKDRKSVV